MTPTTYYQEQGEVIPAMMHAAKVRLRSAEGLREPTRGTLCKRLWSR